MNCSRYQSLDVADNLEVHGIYEYETHTSVFSSVKEYQQDLAHKAGVSLTANTFSDETAKVGLNLNFFGLVSGGFGSRPSSSESTSMSSEQSINARQPYHANYDAYIAKLETDIVL